MYRLILADVESTGVTPADRICEVAWHEIDENFESIDSGLSLINPQMTIAPGASAVNGITNAMVADAPLIEDYMASVGNPLMGEDVVLIAHNVQFDYRYLSPFMSEGAQLIDTLRCARLLYPDAENHKQSTLAYTLGFDMDRSKAHSADGDLDVLLQILKRICADLDCGVIDLLEYQKRPRPMSIMPFGKHKGQSLSELPKAYIQWLFKLDNLGPDLRIALNAL